MNILFRWDQSLLSGATAYYIEIHKNEIDENLLSKLKIAERERLAVGDYIDFVNQWAGINPELAKKNHVYLLVSKDGSECQLMEPYFPYSSQWNAYNPLQKYHHLIIDLSELARLPTP